MKTYSEMFDSIFDRKKKEREEAIRRCAELEEENRRLWREYYAVKEENRKLRAVAEAARKLNTPCDKEEIEKEAKQGE